MPTVEMKAVGERFLIGESVAEIINVINIHKVPLILHDKTVLADNGKLAPEKPFQPGRCLDTRASRLEFPQV